MMIAGLINCRAGYATATDNGNFNSRTLAPREPIFLDAVKMDRFVVDVTFFLKRESFVMLTDHRRMRSS